MILSPLPENRAKLIPVAVMDVDGMEDGDSNPSVVYATTPLAGIRELRRKGGTATAIKSGGLFKWTSMKTGERTIYPTGELSAESIIAWRDYCYSRGISARSLQAMGFYLMRQTLAGRMTLDEGITMPMGIFPASPQLYAKEGVYENVYQSDIRAAYLSALVQTDPVKEYVRVGRTSLREALSYDPGAFVRCSYRVGSRFLSDRFTALAENGSPVRRWGTDRLLSINDLRLIHLLGWDARISEAWIPARTYRKPFSAFGTLIQHLRRDRFLGSVAKIASNTVWGSFNAGSGIYHLVFPGNGAKPKTVQLPPRNKLCQPLAFSIIATLRERLCVEGMGEGTVQAHTDGIIASFPLSGGEEIGEWRTVGFFDRVDVVRPGCYALTVNGQTTYKLAGHSGSDERYRQMFRERLNRWTQRN